MPRRKLARWNSLDACLAEELDSKPGKALAGAPQLARPMAALLEEGHMSDTSDSTLTLGTVKKGQIYPRGLERYTQSAGARSPPGGSNAPPATALKVANISQDSNFRITDTTGSSGAAGAMEPPPFSQQASTDEMDIVSTAVKLAVSTDTGAPTASDDVDLVPPQTQSTPHAAATD